MRADVADEFLDIAHVVVEMERPVAGWHHARVDPVGDEHLVVVQQGTHGVTQQGGVMSRQRRHHQHDGIVLQLLDGGRIVAEALEALQLAERLVQHHALDDGDFLAMRIDLRQVEGGLLVFLAQPVQQLIAGGQALCPRNMRQRTGEVAEHLGAGVSIVAQRAEDGALPLVDLVKHWGKTEGFGKVACYPVWGRRAAPPHRLRPDESVV